MSKTDDQAPDDQYVLTDDDLVALGKLSPKVVEEKEEEEIAQEFEQEENVPLEADDDVLEMAKEMGVAHKSTDPVDVTRVPYTTPLDADLPEEGQEDKAK